MYEKQVNEFIEQNIDLIDNNNFDELFLQASKHLSSYVFPELMRKILKADIDPYPFIHEWHRGMLDLGYTELPHNNVTIPDNVPIEAGSRIQWFTRDASVTLLHTFDVLTSGLFYDSEVDVLILPNTKNLTKIELGAFDRARVDKIVLSKDIDKSKLQVHTLDKEWLLDHIELA